MKYIFILFLYCILIIPYVFTMNVSSNCAGLEDTLMRIDNEFSDLSVAKGNAEAFLQYAANDVILMRQDNLPIFGISELQKHYEKSSGKDVILKWEPIKAEVSVSGELGYTFGKWELITGLNEGNEKSYYGVYVTIWKKQDDGSWKFIFDGGNSTPKF